MSFALRIAHVSDLHLSPHEPSRLEQADHIAASLKAIQPDVIVVTGDLTDDGWDHASDLVFARDWLNCLGLPWRAVPGNHDVGNFADQPEGPVTADRVAAWQGVFAQDAKTAAFASGVAAPPGAGLPGAELPGADLAGADLPEAKLGGDDLPGATLPGAKLPGAFGGWVENLPGVVLIGLNTMLLGSGLDLETKQNAWLRETVKAAEARGQAIAVFQHSPLFLEAIDEQVPPSVGYWLGPRPARRALLDAMASPALRLMGSGHVHQARLADQSILPGCPLTTAWAPPASGAWVSSKGLPNPPAPDQTGYYLHTLRTQRLTSEYIRAAPVLKAVAFTPWP